LCMFAVFAFFTGNVWGDFYGMHDSDWGAVLLNRPLTNITEFAVFFLLGLNVMGLWGLKSVWIRLKNKLTEEEKLFAIYGAILLCLPFVWPDMRVRFVVMFAPIAAFFISKVSSQTPVVIVSLFSLIVSIPLGVMYLHLHGVAADAAEWMNENLEGHSIKTNDNRLTYYLSQDGFAVNEGNETYAATSKILNKEECISSDAQFRRLFLPTGEKYCYVVEVSPWGQQHL